jgi:hypothetical protein
MLVGKGLCCAQLEPLKEKEACTWKALGTSTASETESDPVAFLSLGKKV